MNGLESKYFTLAEIESFKFLRIPKALLNEKYDGLSFGAKFLFSLLFDTTMLSRENNWIDKNGSVYIYYSRERVRKVLRVGEKKAIAFFKELTKYGLIEEVRQGQGRPNKIFVLKFILNEDVEMRNHTETLKKTENSQKGSSETVKENKKIKEITKSEKIVPETLEKTENSQKGSSETVKKEVLKLSKRQANNTKYNDTELTILSQSVSSDFSSTEKTIKENIMYNSMIIIHDKAIIDEIILNMTEMYFVENLKIANAVRPRELVQGIISKIEAQHIDLIANKYKKINTTIKNKKGYLQSMIYNSLFEQEIDKQQFLATIHSL